MKNRFVNPLVNVIVRTKDRPKLLIEALQSIEQQSYRPVKPIIINDGGIDLENEQIVSALKDIPFLYFKHDTNKGRSAALNSALKMSDGEFIYFLDDDDLVYNDGIQSLIDASLKNNRIPVYGKVLCTQINNQTNQVNNKINEEDSENTDNSTNRTNSVEQTNNNKNTDNSKKTFNKREIGEPFDFEKLLFENYIAANSLLVPLNIANQVGLFDENFEIFEDWDWILRMTSLSKPFFINTLIAEYRNFESTTFTGKGGIDYHKKYKIMLLEKRLKKITPISIINHVQRAVDTAVLEKERGINQFKDLSLKFEIESKHYFNETTLLKKEIGLYKEEINRHKEEIIKYKEELDNHKIEINRYKEYIEWQRADADILKQDCVIYKKNIKEKSDHIASIENDFAICRNEKESILNLLNQADDALDELRTSYKEILIINSNLSEEIMQIQEQFEFCQNELIQMRLTIEELNIILKNKLEELSLTYSSVSWKITKPLRIIKALITKNINW